MAASVITLTCPVCGAPFAPESDRCNFCGSILVLKTDHPRIDPRMLNKSVVDEHIAKYRRILRSEPSDETAHYGLGVAYFNLGLIEDSIRELTHAARLMPENPNIQTQLAVVLREAAKQGDADADAQMRYRVDLALRLDPNNLEALLLKADLLSDPVLRYDAIEVLERAHSIDEHRVRPKLIEGLTALAGKQDRMGDWTELPRTWEKLERVDAQLTKRLMTGFLAENKKLIPSRSIRDTKVASVGQYVLLVITAIVATLIAGFVVFAIIFTIFGEDTWVPTATLLTWLAALVIVPIWAVKRKSKKSNTPAPIFDREVLVQGHADFSTTEAAAIQVAQIKEEQKVRRDKALERIERVQARKPKDRGGR